MVAMTNSDRLDVIGEYNLVGNIDETLARAHEIIGLRTADRG